MRRRPTSRPYRSSRPPMDPEPRPPQSTASRGSTGGFFNSLTLMVLAGVFVLGIGLGVFFSTAATGTTANVASREFIDRSAPNPEICAQYGASAIVSDMRFFVTLNPFSVYVSRPKMQPGCVLRRNNWAIIERRNLVTNEQVGDCRRRANTFAFTGDLNGQDADILCVYQNDSAENLYLRQGAGGAGPTPTESDQF